MVASRARGSRFDAFGLLAGGVLLVTQGCGTDDSGKSVIEPDASTGTAGASGSVDASASVDASSRSANDASTLPDASTPRDAALALDASAGEGGGPKDGSADATVHDATVAPGLAVLQHHNDAARDGVYIDPAMTTAVAASLHVDSTFVGPVTGNVYAHPHSVSAGPNNQETFYVATESNHVTAIGASGWDKTFGTPKTGALAGQPCGIVDPLGITGTPIIDLASRTLYFDAMVSMDNNTTLAAVTHQVFAISIDDGTTKAGWPVDIGPLFTSVGTNAANQNQRGALQLIGGILYVPYGGHVGDCTPYRGVVVGIPVTNPGAPIAWSTATLGMTAGRGGIWASGGLASDGTSIYAATGNTSAGDAVSASFVAPAEWSGGEAIFRFAAGPTFSNSPVDYYYPANWADLDKSDSDLGGANPVLFDMPGTPMPHLVAAFGKDGNLYLLNRDSLGKAGGGGELSITDVSSTVILGAPVEYTTSQGTYVAFRGKGVGCPNANQGNLIAVKISAGTPASPAPAAKVAWCSPEGNLGSPMVTTTDGTSNVVVWDASTILYGYDGDTGTKVFTGGATTDTLPNAMQYFNAPIDVGQGRIAIAAPGRLYIFAP